MIKRDLRNGCGIWNEMHGLQVNTSFYAVIILPPIPLMCDGVYDTWNTQLYQQFSLPQMMR